MEKLKWRVPALIGGYLDLIVGVFQLVSTIFTATAVAVFISAPQSLSFHENELYEAIDDFIKFAEHSAMIQVTPLTILILTVMWIPCELIHIWIASRLIKVTRSRRGVNAEKCYSYLKIWLVLTIMSLILEIAYEIVIYFYLLNGILILGRAVLAGIVYKLMEELNTSRRDGNNYPGYNPDTDIPLWN